MNWASRARDCVKLRTICAWSSFPKTGFWDVWICAPLHFAVYLATEVSFACASKEGTALHGPSPVPDGVLADNPAKHPT